MENTNGGPPQILEEARRLICRVPPGYQGAELRVIFDAAKEIPRDEPISHEDSRILRAADRLVALFPEDSEPPPPTPFDDRLEEALAEEAEKKEVWEAADLERTERVLDVASLTGSGSVLLTGRNGRPVAIWTTSREGLRSVGFPNRRHVDKALAAAQAAQEALDLAEEAFKRARVAKNEIAHARSRWRAVASVAK